MTFSDDRAGSTFAELDEERTKDTGRLTTAAVEPAAFDTSGAFTYNMESGKKYVVRYMDKQDAELIYRVIEPVEGEKATNAVLIERKSIEDLVAAIVKDAA